MKQIFCFAFVLCIAALLIFFPGILIAQSLRPPGQPQDRAVDHRDAMRMPLFRVSSSDKSYHVTGLLTSTFLLDPAFGTSGSVRTFIHGGKSTNMDDRAYAMALQADGKIVVAAVPAARNTIIAPKMCANTACSAWRIVAPRII